MEYLRLFNQDADYQAFIGGDYLKPNVSYVKDMKSIFFNPYVPPITNTINCVVDINYDYTYTDITFLVRYSEWGDPDSLDVALIECLKIDDVEVEPTSSYIFNSAGEHTIYVKFAEPLTNTSRLFHTFYITTGWFEQSFSCPIYKKLQLGDLDTSQITDMSYMFIGNDILENIEGLDTWDVGNVTNMYGLFNSCRQLTSLDLSNWDTRNVSDMSYMFSYCYNLTEIRMGGDVSNVTNVNNMFYYVSDTGTFYYNSAYDYSLIIAQLPSGWTSVPCTLVNGKLMPN